MCSPILRSVTPSWTVLFGMLIALTLKVPPAGRHFRSRKIVLHQRIYRPKGYEPMPGNIIFFDWESDGLADHVGIVERVENGLIYTVEGNSGDRCVENRYYLGSSPICRWFDSVPGHHLR